jgi:hypothetical protein
MSQITDFVNTMNGTIDQMKADILVVQQEIATLEAGQGATQDEVNAVGALVGNLNDAASKLAALKPTA